MQVKGWVYFMVTNDNDAFNKISCYTTGTGCGIIPYEICDYCYITCNTLSLTADNTCMCYILFIVPKTPGCNGIICVCSK